jgi:hypothetical protein
MLTKTIILSVMLCIVVALISGLFFLVRDGGETKRPVKALSWRIGLSLGLFLFLLTAYSLKWISPHALLS